MNTRRIRAEEITRRADILVVAAGRPRVVGGSFVKPGATVIDVGINVDESGVRGKMILPFSEALYTVTVNQKCSERKNKSQKRG
ncbi:MAG: hypothetical protein IJL07_04835 [Lachnospiraceae bacterium]|nr:hypothetical protein [Lachnospiraceae bacterium]